MNKKNNIRISVDKIIKEINFPIFTNVKRITFFFGAGINKNIADDTEDWHKLAEQSIDNFAQNISEKDYEKCEINKISKEINNNLLAISLSESPLKIKGRLKSLSKCEWFVKGFEEIENALSNNYFKNVDVITTNYDNFLSKVLKRDQIDLLRDYEDLNIENPIENTIYHLHGIANDSGEIKGESVATLHDYIRHSEQVEKYFTEILTRKKNILDIIIIIGYSMQDLHIIRALKSFTNQKEKMKKVFLVSRLNMCDAITKRIEKIYQEIGVAFLNIKNSNSYEEDFKNFWKLLSEKIKKRSFDLNDFWNIFNVKEKKGKEIYNKKIFLPSLIKKIEEEWSSQKDKIWAHIKNKLVNSIAEANGDVTLLSSKMMWTLLKKGKLSNEEVFSVLRDIGFKLPLEILIEFVNKLKDKLKNSKEKEKDLDQIFFNIDEGLNYYLKSNSFPQIYGNKIINFFEFNKSEFIQKIKKMKLNNIIYFLFNQIFFSMDFNNDEKCQKIQKVFLENFTYLEVKEIISAKETKNYMLNWDFLIDHEKALLFLSKLMKRDLENSKEPIEKALTLWEKGNAKKIFLFFENIFKKYNYWKIELLGLFKIQELALLMKNEATKIISKISKDYRENKDNRNWETKKYLYRAIFTFLYYVWINNNNSEKSFNELKMVLENNGFPFSIFSSFPSTLEIYGKSGSFIKLFSKYDQRLIDVKKKKIISDFEDIKNILKKNKPITDEKQLAIFEYLSKKLTPDIYEKFFKLGNLEMISWNKGITWRCSSFKEYITFFEKTKKIESEENCTSTCKQLLLDFNIKPPKDIVKKIENVIKEIKDLEYKIITETTKNNIDKALLTNTKIIKLYKELAELTEWEYYLQNRSEENTNISICEELFLLTRRAMLIEKINKEITTNKTKIIINKIFNSTFHWKKGRIFKIIKREKKVEKWSELVFLFYYLYYFGELSKFKYNCEQIKTLYEKTNMQSFNFYGIIRYCIAKKSNYVKQFLSLQKLAKWFKQILWKKEEFNKLNVKNLKKNFELDSLRLYLIINDKKAKFNLLASIDDLLNVSFKIIKNRKDKLQNEKFLDVLAKIKIYNYNFASSILWDYSKINKMSEKIKNKLSESFTKCVKSLDINDYKGGFVFWELNDSLQKMQFLTESDRKDIKAHLKNQNIK